MAITMEELRQKAKAYDKVREKIALRFGSNVAEEIFSEYEMSEDERIRKDIISYLRSEKIVKRYISDIEFDKWIAWLEKQVSVDEDEIVEGIRRGVAISLMNHIDANSKGMCLSNMECEDIENAIINEDWDKVYGYMKKKLEKQGEPIDKIEPKFHEGEWIVLIATGSAYQVEKIKNYEYTLRHISGGSVRLSDEKLIREWTIQDAKAGNVLYCKADNGIEYFVMNKGINKCGNIDSYFRYNSLGDFGVDIPSVLSTEDHNITPATKEQRDMLFQKMKEAGYEWDAEKKELKKLTQQEVTKTSDQEEDFIEIPFGAYDSELIEATYFIPEGYYAVIVGDEVVIKKGERKPTWSEEDEHRAKDTIYFLDTAKKHYASTVELDACIDWLNSLKDRVGCEANFTTTKEWSEEDEEMLDFCCDYLDTQQVTWLQTLKQRIGG